MLARLRAGDRIAALATYGAARAALVAEVDVYGALDDTAALAVADRIGDRTIGAQTQRALADLATSTTADR